MMSLRAIFALCFLALCSAQTQTLNYTNRVSCFPEPDVTEEKCKARSCQWKAPQDGEIYADGTPLCYFPKTTGYSFVSRQDNTWIISRKNVAANDPTNPPNPYKSPASTDPDLKVVVTTVGPMTRVWIGSNEGQRFEPELFLLDPQITANETLEFTPQTNVTPFSFVVKRQSNGVNLWDTSIGGLLFADQYIQIATRLPTDKMYGWGENVHHTLKHDFSKYKTWAMFGRDEPPKSPGGENTKNLYGVQPFYMGIESDGKAHGVLILNSNAQEITTGPDPHFVYRTIGGVLDIYFFPGPTPEDVVKQFQSLTGNPYMPAYFALGYQLSRYGYPNLQDMKDAVNRTLQANIPLEVPYADIDYMKNFMDFTLSDNFTDLGTYGAELHNKSMKLFLMFDPAIDVTSDPFKRALNAGASFIRWPDPSLVPQSVQSMYNSTNNTDIMLGVVWPNNHCAFPDFLDPQSATKNWWIQEFKDYHDKIPFDGIWIDMNEPANFGTNQNHPWYFDDPDHPFKIAPLNCSFTGNWTKYDDPPFKTHNVFVYNDPNAKISDKTLCMLGTTARGTHNVYDTKSLYGVYEARITSEAMQASIGKRGAIITRANFISTGRYAGHWLGDNSATWEDMQTSVVGIQEYNLFGIPYIGSDICGFHNDTTEELCLRWHQLGAFYTFSRNHNGKGYRRQDPAQWDSVAKATKQAYEFRYGYLPYLYSLHFDAHLNGGTVIRPVFFEFPKDPRTHNLGNQFMWGSAIMAIPVLNQGDVTVSGYLPESAVWYSLRENEYGQRFTTAENMSASWTEMIPVFIKGGSVVPYQNPAMTTAEARKNNVKIIIALGNSITIDVVELMVATGFLYWDDGLANVQNNTYCKFEFTLRVLKTRSVFEFKSTNWGGSCERKTIESIDILGMPFAPDRFILRTGLDWVATSVNASYDSSRQLLRLPVGDVGLFLRRTTDQALAWLHKEETTVAPTTVTTTAAPTTVTTTAAPTKQSTTQAQSLSPSTITSAPPTAPSTAKSSPTAAQETTVTTSAGSLNSVVSVIIVLLLTLLFKF